MLEQSYTYLFINAASLAIPLAFSFERRIQFFGQWKFWSLSIIIPGAFFIAWDVIFTNWGIWGFNSSYITGVYLLDLPIEEWLFFFCIPYACLFTYTALNHLFLKEINRRVTALITFSLAGILLLVLCFNMDKAYTSTTFSLLLLALLVHYWWIPGSYLGKFYIVYAFILIPFFIVNGVLTGSFIEGEVVWYNNQENLGLRIFTIPVEDTFYGMLLILMNVTIFESLKKRSAG